MYLSKIELDWKKCYNPYEWHRAIWKLFPDMNESCRDFLFRLEDVYNDCNRQVILQSPIMPNNNSEKSIIINEVKRIDLQSILSNELFFFRVNANVTKKIKDADNPERSVRVPLIKEEEQISWLTRKFEGAGSIINVVTTKRAPLYFKKGGSSGKIVTVTFDGVIKVTNPEIFLGLITSGIGSAKSFGCGLISIAPVS